MKKILEFFKTTIIGGLFVVLPLFSFYLLLAELLELAVALATPIADLLPKGAFDQINMTAFISVILIIVAFFLFGLALRSEVLRRLGRKVERSLLGRLPLYNALRSLSRGLVGAQEDSAFRSAVLNSPNGEREIVYVIEDHGDGQVTVLVPWAPAFFAGPVKILSSDRIEMLGASLGDTSRVLGQWGMGARDLLNNKYVSDKSKK